MDQINSESGVMMSNLLPLSFINTNFKKEVVSLVASRPHMGKSVFAWCLAANFIRQKQRVLFFSPCRQTDKNPHLDRERAGRTSQGTGASVSHRTADTEQRHAREPLSEICLGADNRQI